jgi:hypothetical protein
MSVPQVQIDVTTQSQQISSGTDPAQVPAITLNGNPLSAATNKPVTASGWQFVVLDSAQDMTQPASVVSNLYTPLFADNGGWGDWEAMYDIMLTQSLTSGNTGSQIVIVSSYGLDSNIPPTNPGLEMLLGYGAGPQIQSWLNTPNLDIGSEGGDWTSFPANYILIGASSLGFGLGTEAFELGDTQPITSQATATFANPGALAAAALTRQ